MWVFGYGSLMWDGWEQQFDGVKIDGAELDGYRRAFSKKSIENWGTATHPCPTLGLERAPAATCIGAAFGFPTAQKQAVWTYLRDREGPSFGLEKRRITLPDGRRPQAHVAINDPDAESYIGDKHVDEIAAMIGGAHGTEGACIDYLENTIAKLRTLSIENDAIESLWEAVQQMR